MIWGEWDSVVGLEGRADGRKAGEVGDIATERGLWVSGPPHPLPPTATLGGGRSKASYEDL